MTARLVYTMNMSLDGYVDHTGMGGPPGPELFRHFIEMTRGLTGTLYGRGLYQIMAYWDEDQADWDADERAFAEAWRAMPKWVVSKSLDAVGPNATLLEGDLNTIVRALRADRDGDIGVGGPVLAGSLTKLGLIDVYQPYVRPFVMGGGKPYFTGPRPPLRLIANDVIGEDALRLTYAPA